MVLTLTRNRSACDSSASAPPTSTQSPSGLWSAMTACDWTALRVRTTNVEGGVGAGVTPRWWSMCCTIRDVVRLQNVGQILHHIYRAEQKNLAKFSDTCSVRAGGLCIGSPRLVGGRKAGNSNMQEFFLATHCT